VIPILLEDGGKPPLSLISLSRSRSVEPHGSMSWSLVLSLTGILHVLLVMILVEVRPSVDT
jgi:hypothetical protein